MHHTDSPVSFRFEHQNHTSLRTTTPIKCIVRICKHMINMDKLLKGMNIKCLQAKVNSTFDLTINPQENRNAVYRKKWKHK